MEHSSETSVDEKLRSLIWYLVTAFPQAAILSRQVEERYHVFIIVPYGGGPEKAIQVERALLLDQDLSVDELGLLLDTLNLPTLLQGCERYDLNEASWRQTQVRALAHDCYATGRRYAGMSASPTQDGQRH